MQLVHVAADFISDWDCLVDCFDQFYSQYVSYYHDVRVSEYSLLNLPELNANIAALLRMNRFSKFLTNENLIRLMTSFVALSMNEIANSLNHIDISNSVELDFDITEVISGALIDQPSYMDKAILHGFATYSLKMVVEVTKVNAFRLSIVWQMVTSHIRQMALSKVDLLLIRFF